MAMKTYGKTLEGFSGRNNLNPDSLDVIKLMEAYGITDKRKNNRIYNGFSRIPTLDPTNTMTVTHEYLFFTKPDLHLINYNTGQIAESLSTYSFFIDALDRYRPVCEQLQFSMHLSKSIAATNTQNPFMTILSNTARSELDLPDIEAENEVTTGANVYGTKITYRGNSYPSDQDCSFSIEFEDTKYLEVYMLFKIYDEYCRYKNMGLIDFTGASDEERWLNYTINKVLHDQFSVYKFVVGEDGFSLVYWAKYTGVFPTGVPRSALSEMNNNEGQRLTVSFKAQFVRDMDPIILSDFNKVSLGSKEYQKVIDLNSFDPDLHMMSGEWASVPYIAAIDYTDGTYADKMARYRLHWKKYT